jgi:hypothetical protein
MGHRLNRRLFHGSTSLPHLVVDLSVAFAASGDRRVLLRGGTEEVTRLDFGLTGLDTTVRPGAASAGLPLRIPRRTFSKGVGVHARAEFVVPLGGRYQTFETLAGVFPSDQLGFFACGRRPRQELHPCRLLPTKRWMPAEKK